MHVQKRSRQELMHIPLRHPTPGQPLRPPKMILWEDVKHVRIVQGFWRMLWVCEEF